MYKTLIWKSNGPKKLIKLWEIMNWGFHYSLHWSLDKKKLSWLHHLVPAPGPLPGGGFLHVSAYPASVWMPSDICDIHVGAHLCGWSCDSSDHMNGRMKIHKCHKGIGVHHDRF